MSDANGDAAQSNDSNTAPPSLPKMRILGQFIRDMSFENLAAQKALTNIGQPDIQVKILPRADKRPVENQYNVILKVQIEGKTKETDPRAIFLLEIEYGGIFHIENITMEQLPPYLYIECPRLLFPFVRRIISDITHDGGYPPLYLDNIDFLDLYKKQIESQKNAKTYN